MLRISKQNTLHNAAGLIACLILAAGVAGCRIHVDKDPHGDDKRVQVDTPFGGIHVNTNQTTAADLGLPDYPGAEIAKDKDDDKSADIHMGFGEWEMRMKVVSYTTPDDQDKVTAFYKKALARYGDVITCRDNAAVGTPTVTTEGLTCDDSGHHPKVQIGDSYKTGAGGFELKAGSWRHQHIVGFDAPKDGQTRFALVALDLPAGLGGDSGKSD